jgi:hypothetical protein
MTVPNKYLIFGWLMTIPSIVLFGEFGNKINKLQLKINI